MDRHPLDGDAIAADRHYGQDGPEDYEFCERCGCPFEDPDMDGARWLQHPTMFMFCTDCADEAEDEQ